MAFQWKGTRCLRIIKGDLMKFIFHCENFIIVVLKSQGHLNQGHVLF